MLSRLVISVWDLLGASECNDDQIARGNTAVVEVTKSIMARRDSSRNTIQFLCMTFFLRGDDPMSIGHAVAQTMATQKVELAEFTIYTEKEDTACSADDLIHYGRQFMSFFDACPIAFGGLTRFDLENLRFGESDIRNVLDTCKRLKHVRLFNCDSGSSQTVLQVEHSQLCELAIVDCSIERVELTSLPKLTRFIFECWISFQDPLSFGYVPLLEAVSLANICLSWHKMVKLSKFLWGTSVRDLKLGFDFERIWVQPECLTVRLASVFNQIRFVNLADIPEGYDHTWTLFILKAAPNLKEIYMTVWDHLCVMKTNAADRRAFSYSEKKGIEWESSPSDFQHQSLATVTIFGFQAQDYMISYVRRVMEAAVNLQDVFLYNKLVCHNCCKKPSGFPSKQKQYSVKELITNGINSSAIIHFHTPGGVTRADHLKKMWFV